VDVRTVERLLTKHAIDLIVFSSSYQLNGSFHKLEKICRENRIAMRIVSPESDCSSRRPASEILPGADLHPRAQAPLNHTQADLQAGVRVAWVRLMR